jgi:hypothetical protein
MDVEVDITGTENEAASELKRVLAQLVLPVSGCTGSFPCPRIILAENMKERAVQETHGTISMPFAINQKWERDSGLFAKQLGIVCIAQANGGQPGAFIAECLFVVAQLRDVLAAKDSSVVAKEGDHCGLAGPERPESDRPSFGVGQHNFREFLTHRLLHALILK